jgi:hypothetical protein
MQQPRCSPVYQIWELIEEVKTMQNRKTVEEKEAPNACASGTMSDEVLRYQISRLIDEFIKVLDEPKPHPESWLKRTLKHPLTSIIVGFILTGILGAILTNHFSNKQKDLEHERTINQKEIERARSFADEINKTRVTKVGEVMEKVDVYEAGVRSILDRFTVDPNTNLGTLKGPIDAELSDKFKQTESLYPELSGLLEKNKFWLGDHIYKQIKSYVDETFHFFIDLKSGQITRGDEEKRDKARLRIDEIRDKLLNGEI